MRDYKPETTFGIRVYGDWETVIRTGEKIRRGTSDDVVYEKLLRSKPDDQDRADFKCYEIAASTPACLFGLWRAFWDERLTVELFCTVKSESLKCSVNAATGDGYSRKSVPFSMVDLDAEAISGDMKTAVNQAIEILRKAV